jgi:hypothetical protein
VQLVIRVQLVQQVLKVFKALMAQQAPLDQQAIPVPQDQLGQQEQQVIRAQLAPPAPLAQLVQQAQLVLRAILVSLLVFMTTKQIHQPQLLLQLREMFNGTTPRKLILRKFI